MPLTVTQASSVMISSPSPTNGAQDLHENLLYIGDAAFPGLSNQNELSWTISNFWVWSMHHFSRNDIHSTALFPSLPHSLESGKGLGSSITWMTSGRHALGGANTQLRRSSLKDTSCVWRVWPRDYRRSWFSSSSIQHSTIICGWAPPPYIARFTGLPGDRSDGIFPV